MKKLMLAVATGLVTMGAAQAQQAQAPMYNTYSPQYYVGIGGAIGKNQATDDTRVTPKIFAGVDFDQHWGVEGGYSHSNTKDYNVNLGNNNVGKAYVNGDSAYVAGKYTMPVNDRISAYGKLGVSYNERENTGVLGNYTDRQTGAYGGLGAQYKLNERLSVVAEYERYGKSENTGMESNIVSVGLKAGF